MSPEQAIAIPAAVPAAEPTIMPFAFLLLALLALTGVYSVYSA
jgi:hypothetical protein